MTSNKGDKNLKREWNAASKLLLNKVLSRGIPASKYFSPCAKVSNSSNSVGRLSRRPLFFSCRDQALLAVDTLPTGSKLCHKLSGVAFQKPHHLK